MYRPAQMVPSGGSTARMRYLDDGNSFTPVAKGTLKQISVGNSKIIWGVNAKNQVFTWAGDGWRQVKES